MQLLSSTLFVFACSLAHHFGLGDASTVQGLTLLTDEESSCICPGRQLTYECTIVGPDIQYSVWKGGALTRSNCNAGLSLRHVDFTRSGSASDSCNNGAIAASITNITGNTYTSRLTINSASLTLDGESVECLLDNGADESRVAITIVRLTTAAPPPPNDVRLVGVQSSRITFNWTSVDPLCDSISYNILSSNCGQCPTTTSNTTVTYTDVVASGQLCTVRVQPVLCGNLTGNSSYPTVAILKPPKVPAVNIVPRYDHTTGRLLSIETSFEAAEAVTIADGFDNNIASYMISHLDSTTGNICSAPVRIQVSSCPGGTCKHVFDVDTTSFCSTTTDITVSVTAVGLLGTELTSDPITIDSQNRFVDVDTTFVGNTMTVTCTFLEATRAGVERSCTVLYGLDRDISTSCDILSSRSLLSQLTVYSNQSRVSVDLPTFKMTAGLDEIVTVCFIVKASDGVHTTEAEGTLTVSTGCDVRQLTDGTALPSNVQCSSPLYSAGITDGLVCYTGTGIGAIATHYCFNCAFDPSVSSSNTAIRTCLPNGSWNGTIPNCNCGGAHTNKNSAVVYTAIPMGMIIIIITGVLVLAVVLLFASRRQLKNSLREMKGKEKMQIYDDIDLSQVIVSSKNVAYETPAQAHAANVMSHLHS